MNYYFRKNLTVQESVLAIAVELVYEGMMECDSTSLSHHEIIHEQRKRCKRLRGLLRIVRPNLGTTYRAENIFFRDLSRRLSGIRDQHAAVETLEKLKLKYKKKPLHQDIQSLISTIELKEDRAESLRLITEFKEEINSSFTRINNWEITSKGFDALSGGIRKTYNRGRIAMQQAFINPTAENYHEWRKRVKYHYYHLELLIPIWRKVVRSYTNEVHSLSEKLGYDHDLCLLADSLTNSKFQSIDDQTTQRILEAIMKEQEKLRRDIGILGKKIYAEKSAAIVNKLGSWWDIWEKGN